jgi:hypothetical protein
MTEFQKELAILKGRVDGHDARVGVLEANQFSTTTKLKGIATMTIGGTSNGGTAIGNLPAYNASGNSVNDHIAFNYDVKLNLDTSFTGKDLLRTTLRANNFQNSVFGQAGSAALEVASSPNNTATDGVGISRLFYQFPVGANWTATVGGKVRQDDMLAMWPSAYGADTILDRMTYAGAPGAYSLNLGAGAGLSYKKNGFSISANYISNQLTAGNSGNVDQPVAGSGQITNESGVGSASTITGQVGYAASNWGMAFAYTYANRATSIATLDPNASYVTVGANSLGFSAYWQPKQTGIIPAISAGVGTSYYDGNLNGNSHSTWQVALQWNDAFIKGNALGMAYGATAVGGTFGQNGQGTGGFTSAYTPSYAYELFYKFQVTDNISVTPAFFWIDGNGNGNALGGSTASNTGGLIKTTFKF